MIEMEPGSERNSPEFRGKKLPVASEEPWWIRYIVVVATWLMNAPWILIVVGAAILCFGAYRLGTRTTPAAPQSGAPSVPAGVPASGPPSWNIPAGPKGGPIGPIAAAQLVQWFNDHLPKPCVVKITHPPDSELGRTISWLVQYGGGNGLCTPYQDNNQLRNADSDPSIKPTTEPGIIIHWDESFSPGERIAHFFYSMGFNVRISHKMPERSPSNLIWIDIGPDSPWK